MIVQTVIGTLRFLRVVSGCAAVALAGQHPNRYTSGTSVTDMFSKITSGAA